MQSQNLVSSLLSAASLTSVWCEFGETPCLLIQQSWSSFSTVILRALWDGHICNMWFIRQTSFLIQLSGSTDRRLTFSFYIYYPQRNIANFVDQQGLYISISQKLHRDDSVKVSQRPDWCMDCLFTKRHVMPRFLFFFMSYFYVVF